MTREQFDIWIEQHYGELLKVARRRGHKADDPADIVAIAVARMLAHGGYATTDKPWTWAALYVRGVAGDERKKANNLHAFREITQAEFESNASLGRTGPKPKAQ